MAKRRHVEAVKPWVPPAEPYALNDYVKTVCASGLYTPVHTLIDEPGRVVAADTIPYRQELPGAPTVKDLIPIGALVQANWDHEPTRVFSVTHHPTCTCDRSWCAVRHPGYEDKSFLLDPEPYCHELWYWSVSMVHRDAKFPPSEKQHGILGINELIGVGGRILMLFERNHDEVFVVERPKGVHLPAAPKMRHPRMAKAVQLSMF